MLRWRTRDFFVNERCSRKKEEEKSAHISKEKRFKRKVLTLQLFSTQLLLIESEETRW